ncbi:MAG: hypothetical protein K1060chlam5_00068 [Candidatus Anoxychlamydiales bacterium]|nr:hypothetical protein [Candidatus Anoxychlamydiales bacterium]
MNSLPSSFGSDPNMDPRKYFRNLLISFKKEINNSNNLDTLQDQMQSILNAAKDLNYKEHNNARYHKEEAEKALKKVFNEFDRYFTSLSKKEKTNSQDLLNSIKMVEVLLEEGDIS